MTDDAQDGLEYEAPQIEDRADIAKPLIGMSGPPVVD
jgi:hypothetical protein